MSATDELPPEDNTVAKVRRLVIREANVSLSHPAVLVASELAANAVRHAATVYKVTVRSGHSIYIEVSDGAVGLPIRALAGLGTRVVARLSESWGVKNSKRWKTVWAVVPR